LLALDGIAGGQHSLGLAPSDAAGDMTADRSSHPRDEQVQRQPAAPRLWPSPDVAADAHQGL